MAKSARSFAVDDEDRASPPLTAAERAALKRAEADLRADRLHDHDDIAAWLRQRAAAIVKQARKTGSKRR